MKIEQNINVQWRDTTPLPSRTKGTTYEIAHPRREVPNGSANNEPERFLLKLPDTRGSRGTGQGLTI